MTSWRMTLLKMIAANDHYTSHSMWQWAYDQENEERDNKLVVLPLAFLALVILFILLVVIPMMTVNFDYDKIDNAIKVTGKITVALVVSFLLAFGSIAIRETISRWRDE